MSLADDTKAFLSTCGVCGIWESEEIGVCEWFFCCLVCDKVFVIVFVDIAINVIIDNRLISFIATGLLYVAIFVYLSGRYCKIDLFRFLYKEKLRKT